MRFDDLASGAEFAAEAFGVKSPSPFATDPAGWVKDRLGEHLWSKQRDIAASVVDHKRTAVQSCHDAGKSFIASRLIAWWIDSHPPGEAFVVSTAPSFPQVRMILWREIGKAHKKGSLPGRVNQTEWWLGSEPVGYGRKPSDYDEHSFQGIHARYVLVVLDEACGIPSQLWTAVEAITTNADCRILAIGNPDDPASHFAKVCKPGSGWNTIKISAFDTPNFTDEVIPDALRYSLMDAAWPGDMAKDYGTESPVYISKVTGEFPDTAVDTLISIRDIEAAQARFKDAPTEGYPVALGVDVARFGTDQTIITKSQGIRVEVYESRHKQDTMQTTGHVIVAARKLSAVEIRVDGVGVGGGVVDRLGEQGFPVLDMQAGAGANDSAIFLNARAEWYWGLRQEFEQGTIAIDPDDDELATQLLALKYRYTSRGQLVMESKEDMKKRGLPSPDRADAVMLARAKVNLPAGIVYTSDDILNETDYEYEAAGISPY